MPELLDNMREIFIQVQYNKRNHPQCIAKMKKLFETVDETEFVKAFINCLTAPLSHAEKHPKVENTLNFAAKFAVSVYSFNNESDEEELCPFWSELFNFLLSHHDVEDTAIRFRMVFFLSLLLSSMGENAFINDALCDRITTNMMERLLDTVPKIRAQAVFALRRLQDPKDENCPVTKAFIFHLCKDPQAEVRRAVLMTIGKNKETLAVVLRRTRDVNDGVRKLAYEFLSKISVKSLKIVQREKLLSDGLRDRSEKVSEYVKNELLPVWLEHYEGKYIKLLGALDAEMALDISILMLEILFKATLLRNIIEQVPVDEDTKLIPFDKLSAESVIYWRCTVEHLHREECQDEVDRVLPELSEFCKYISEFIKFMEAGSRNQWEKATLKFVLLQLFQIVKTYDLHDEVGRRTLEQLILDILKSVDSNSESLVDCIVDQLVAVVPSSGIRLNLLADVIGEMREPVATSEVVPLSEAEKHEREMRKARFTVELLQAREDLDQAIKDKDFLKADSLNKRILVLNGILSELSTEPVVEQSEEGIVMENDAGTLTKRLQIMVSMMQNVRTLCPLLRTLFGDIVLPSLDHPADSVVILALKALTLCCLLDVNLAKIHIPAFLVQFGVESNEIWLTSLKGIFDLLVRYGLEELGMLTSSETDDADLKANKSRMRKTVRLFSNSEVGDMTESPRPVTDGSNKNIISILASLLDNVNQDLRTIATEGLCKLLLHRRIFSPPLLARLIILWHNPVTNDDVYLRQCLSFFFNNFPVIVPRSQEMLERSFLTTLKILAKAPSTSPLHDIEPIKVARLIIHLSRSGVQNGPLDYCAHNNLAFAIIAEALNEDSDIDPGVLVRSLRYLEVDLENDSTKKCLQEAVEKLLSSIESSDKRAINAIIYFKRTLYNQPVETEIEQEDEAMNEDEVIIEDEIEDPDTNCDWDYRPIPESQGRA